MNRGENTTRIAIHFITESRLHLQRVMLMWNQWVASRVRPEHDAWWCSVSRGSGGWLDRKHRHVPLSSLCLSVTQHWARPADLWNFPWPPSQAPQRACWCSKYLRTCTNACVRDYTHFVTDTYAYLYLHTEWLSETLPTRWGCYCALARVWWTQTPPPQSPAANAPSPLCITEVLVCRFTQESEYLEHIQYDSIAFHPCNGKGSWLHSTLLLATRRGVKSI